MDHETTEKIRVRAHQIWEAEGRPDARDIEHWEQAEAEIANEAAAMESEGGRLRVTPYNDPTRAGGPVVGGAYPDSLQRKKAG